METSKLEDSIQVIENDDGSFTLHWDENDPRWSFLNEMTEEQATDWFCDSIKKHLDRISKIIPVEYDPVTRDAFITIPEEIVEKLQWKEGDEVEWIVNDDGTLSLVKV